MTYDRRAAQEETPDVLGELQVAEYVVFLLALYTYLRYITETAGEGQEDDVSREGLSLLRRADISHAEGVTSFIGSHLATNAQRAMLDKALRFRPTAEGVCRRAVLVRTLLSRGGTSTMHAVFLGQKARAAVKVAVAASVAEDADAALDKFAVIPMKNARVRAWIDRAAQTAGSGALQNPMATVSDVGGVGEDTSALLAAKIKGDGARASSEEQGASTWTQEQILDRVRKEAEDTAKRSMEVSGEDDAPPKRSEVIGLATAAAVSALSDPSLPQNVPSALQGLDPEQLAAAMTDGRVLVAAGAGSGKTSTLVARLAYLVKDRGVSPSKIFAVSFNTKAAAEIRERLAPKVGQEALDQMAVGTMHSIFRQFVVQYGTPEERAALTTWLMTAPRRKTGPQQNTGRAPSPGAFAGYMARIWKECFGEDPPARSSNVVQAWMMNDVTPEQAKAQAVTPEEVNQAEWYRWTLGFKGVNKSFTPPCIRSNQKADKMWGEFLAKWRGNGAARLGDFSDMILMFRDLLKRDPAVRRKIQAQFDHIAVDECVEGSSLVRTKGGQVRVDTLVEGQEILSYENGTVVFKKVLGKRVSSKDRGLEITTASGRTLSMTYDHPLYATPFEASLVPEGSLALYLMFREGYGFRIGVSKNPCNSRRAVLEHADRLWVLDVGPPEDILYKEQAYSLRWGVPTYIFEGEVRGCDQKRIDAIFKEFGENGRRLLAELGLNFEFPHWFNQTHTNYSRLVLTLQAHHPGRLGGTELRSSWSGASPFPQETPNIYQVKGRSCLNVRGKSYSKVRGVASTLAKEPGVYLTENMVVEGRECVLTTAGALRVGMGIPAHVGGRCNFRNDRGTSHKELLDLAKVNGVVLPKTLRDLSAIYDAIRKSQIDKGMDPLPARDDTKIEIDKIVSIREVSGRYYDLTIEDTGNFFPNDLLSHNCQDLNTVQHQIVSMLSEHVTDGKDGKSVWIVGDPAQSINAFVGAKPELFAQFHGKAGWTERQIATNYRCLPEIVETANRLMTNHPKVIPMQSRPDARKPRGQASIVVRTPATHAQGAIGIVQGIKQDTDAGSPVSDYAVLSRTNLELNDYETACIVAGVPYARRGGTSFLRSPETITVMSYFNLVVGSNFERMQRSLGEVLNKPNRFFLQAGMSDTIVASVVRDRARRDGVSDTQVNPLDLFDDEGIRSFIRAMDPRGDKAGWQLAGMREQLENLGRALEGMRGQVESGKTVDREGRAVPYTTQSLMGDILNLRGVSEGRGKPAPTLRDVLMPFRGGQEEEADAPDDGEAAKKPIGNVEFLFQIAQPSGDPENDPSNPVHFKSKIDQLVVASKDLRVDLDEWDAEQKRLPPDQRSKPPCVNLSTIHAVKGAQWPSTTVVMAQGIFPFEGGNKVDESKLTAAQLQALQERRERDYRTERQLAYVALTRAAKDLTVVCPSKSAYGRDAGISPFVNEAGLRPGQNVAGKNDPSPDVPVVKTMLAFVPRMEEPDFRDEVLSYDRRAR
jgi:superfamily I DNA/RNA helicase